MTAATIVVAPRRMIRRLRATRQPWLRQPLAIIGLVIIVLWLAAAVLAPLVAPADPLLQNSVPFLQPSAAHLLGTDQLGRDLLSRVIYGARLSIPLALLLVAISVLVGSTLGAIAGYVGGIVDAVVMRTADLVFAFPAIILAMAIAAALGPSLANAVIAVAAVVWPVYARVARGLVLGQKQSDFVLASRLVGASRWRALFKEIAPNIVGPIVALAALEVGNAILLLSGLSFLGLGARPPAAEWGTMVAAGAANFDRWWIGLFPGLAISSVVLAFNFVGDALRDALDPRTARVITSR